MKTSTVVLVALCVALCAATKLGVSWDSRHGGNLGAITGGSHTSWYYSWSVWRSGGDNGRRFIPQVWGRAACNDIQNAINGGHFNGADAVLGFNEPDRGDGANLDPGTAAALWRQYMEPLRGRGLRLGSPAVASNDEGKNWLRSFFNNCGGCNIDFVAIHWYGANANDFINYVNDMHNSFGRNIWVTEFACNYGNCDQNSVYGFMGQTTQFLDNAGFVERFAWFGERVGGVPDTNCLLDGGLNSLTGLGGQYINTGGWAGAPSNGGCVDEETPIVLADGSTVNAGDVKVGDKLMGLDGVPGVVGMILRHEAIERDMISINGGRAFATADHPFLDAFTNRSTVHNVAAAKATGLLYTYTPLLAGTSKLIVYNDGKWSTKKVESIEIVRRSVRVVYFIIHTESGVRSYVSGGLLTGTEARPDIESRAGALVMRKAVLAMQDDILSLWKRVASVRNDTSITPELFSHEFIPKWKESLGKISDSSLKKFKHLVGGTSHEDEWNALARSGDVTKERHVIEISDTVVRMLYPPVHMKWLSNIKPANAGPIVSVITELLKNVVAEYKI